MTQTIHHIASSARMQDSTTRGLSNQIARA